MSQALRKITGRLSATGTTAIFINQLRERWVSSSALPKLPPVVRH